MTALRPFRFEVIAYDAQSREEWGARARRIEYGISYIAVFDEQSEAFAPVVARLAGQKDRFKEQGKRENVIHTSIERKHQTHGNGFENTTSSVTLDHFCGALHQSLWEFCDSLSRVVPDLQRVYADPGRCCSQRLWHWQHWCVCLRGVLRRPAGATEHDHLLDVLFSGNHAAPFTGCGAPTDHPAGWSGRDDNRTLSACRQCPHRGPCSI